MEGLIFMNKTEKTKGQGVAYASILLAATLWGILGLWTRQLMAGGLSPFSIAVVRNFGGMLMLVAIFAVKDRSVFRVKREHLKYFFGTGVVSVLLFTVCYFNCQQVASLAVAFLVAAAFLEEEDLLEVEEAQEVFKNIYTIKNLLHINL